MLSCHRALQVFRVSESFPHGYFLGPNIFLVGISWVQNYFSWVFRGSRFFLSWIFRGSKYLNISFLMGISWVRDFFSWLIHGFNFSLMVNFLIQRLSIAGCMRKSDRKRRYVKRSQTVYFIPNRFQQLSFLFTLEKCFIFSISYAIMQLSVFLVISLIAESVFIITISSLVTVIDGYWKNNCPVSLIIQISWLLILRIPLPEKSPSSFFNFWSIRRPKMLSFRGSETPPSFQFLRAMLTAWLCVVSKIKINNKINRLHKSTYEELLEKHW